MAILPPPLAAVLAVTPKEPMIMCSDTLSPEEDLAARLMACTKALTGAVVVVVTQEELRRVRQQVAEAREREHLLELAEHFQLADVLANQ